jgi:hypothetical protein
MIFKFLLAEPVFEDIALKMTVGSE